MLSIASAKAALAARRQQNQEPVASAPAARQTPDPKPSETNTPKTVEHVQRVEGENRNAERHSAAAVPSITSLRISPHGAEASLVNISASGVLAECSVRLQPGSLVTVIFEGTFRPASAEGRVARSSVASVGAKGGLRYHVGISFTRPIVIDGALVVTARREPAADQPPAAPPPPIARNRW